MESAEISYDLVMEPKMSFVEGTYRLPGHDWQVFIFSHGDVKDLQVSHGKWSSGVTGVHITFPRVRTMNQAKVERILSAALGVELWRQVRGPDSMQLR
jgi:hypothetical protein